MFATDEAPTGTMRQRTLGQGDGIGTGFEPEGVIGQEGLDEFSKRMQPCLDKTVVVVVESVAADGGAYIIGQFGFGARS